MGRSRSLQSLPLRWLMALQPRPGPRRRSRAVLGAGPEAIEMRLAFTLAATFRERPYR